MLNEIFPAVYRRLRLRAGLTQAELGKRLGLCRATVYKYESGKARPGATQEQALLKLASCSDREWVELICEQLSGVVLARVVVLDDRGENEPANLLAKANAVIAQGRTAIPKALYRALVNKVNATQSLGLLLERSNADLEELVRDCVEAMEATEGIEMGASDPAKLPSPLPTLPDRDAEPARND